jgi:plastocyanin
VPRHRALRLATLVIVALILAIPAPVSSQATVTELTVRAGEADEVYYYTPDVLTVRGGRVRLTFVNEGMRGHTFNLKQQGKWRDLYNFPLVQAGEMDVFEFEITPGEYVFFCSLYKHVDHGQTGMLVVTP